MTSSSGDLDETGRVAVVASTTRRFVDLIDGDERVRAISASSALHVVVGDDVTYIKKQGDASVVAVKPRRNVLTRVYGREERMIAANIDLVCAVVAMQPLFNAVFVDRCILATQVQRIPFLLIVNKIDKGLEETEPALKLYRHLGVEMLLISAKKQLGFDELQQRLKTPGLNRVVFCGLSGVGKSTLLQALLPTERIKTGAVSERIGQGRQTTSQAVAYRRKLDFKEQFLIDTPGFQNFGVGHLPRDAVLAAYPDLLEYAAQCEFGNCSHEFEEECAVKKALANNKIAYSRYLSYTGIMQEIRDHQTTGAVSEFKSRGHKKRKNPKKQYNAEESEDH